MDQVDLSEAATRKVFIDKALEKAGWGPIVRFHSGIHYDHGSVEEYPTSSGPADYILFHKSKPLVSVEGKKIGIGPQNVLQQAKRYARDFLEAPVSYGEYNLPFAYSTNGKVFWFQDLRDPLTRPEKFLVFTLLRPLQKC